MICHHDPYMPLIFSALAVCTSLTWLSEWWHIEKNINVGCIVGEFWTSVVS